MRLASSGEIIPTSGFSRDARLQTSARRVADLDLVQASFWRTHDGIGVLSTLVDATAPDGSGDTIPQWHLSVSADGQRPTADHLRRVIDCFGIDEFELDNHHPGIAQHIWIPVDTRRRVDCECKSDETIIVEDDGYTWTNPTVGPCRGCEYKQLTGRRCSLHMDAA